MLLECERPRFEGYELELGQFEADGPLLVLVGDWGPLFSLLAGESRLADGKLRVLGKRAEGLARTHDLGLARADSPFPSSWTLDEVLSESARLLGYPKRVARDQTRQVAAELGLSEWLGKKLATLGPGLRRTVGIAAALLGHPPVLALEDPMGGLEPSDQAFVSSVVERTLAGRQVLLSVAEIVANPERDALLARASELLVVGRGGLSARGSRAELLRSATSYQVSLLRSSAALLSRLTLAGYEARAVTEADATRLLIIDGEGHGTEPLFAAALELGTPILELRPLYGAMSPSSSEKR